MMLGGDHRTIAEAICKVEGYTLGEEIGEGSFKHSFKVQAGEGEFFCLKLYKGNLSEARSDREVKAIRRCNHPGIAKLLSVGHFDRIGGDQILYSVEEFIGGGSLDERLSDSPLSADEVRQMGKALSEAIAETASLSLVHRDIKPANIMLREDGTPVLVDFGLVRVLDDSSMTPTWLTQGPGTPLFAAPEQLNNKKDLIDWRTDQFGLGATLGVGAFEMHPYAEDPADKPPDVIQRVADRNGPSVAFLNRARDSGLGVLARMAEPWPVQRFRTPQLLIGAW